MKAPLCLFACLLISITGLGWSNGGKTTSANDPKFGTHDWIAYEAYRLARQDVNLNWLREEVFTYFIGTEAPDSGVLEELRDQLDIQGGYRDTAACHCVLYGDQLEVAKTRAATRAQEEFDKGLEAISSGDRQLAAFYAGAMAHYIGDLAQFMHLMGSQSRWGSEDQSLHKRYEEVIDKTMNAHNWRSSLLSPYITQKDVPGDTAKDVALAVAKYVDTGGNTIRTPGWMYGRWQIYIGDGRSSQPDNWENKFRDQTGRNVNMGINGIAKLLRQLTP